MAKKPNYIQSEWPQAIYVTYAGKLSTSALIMLVYSVIMLLVHDHSADYGLIISGTIWSIISILLYIMIDYFDYRDNPGVIANTLTGFVSLISMAYIYLFGLYLVFYCGIYGLIQIGSAANKVAAGITALLSVLVGYSLVKNLDKIMNQMKHFKAWALKQSETGSNLKPVMAPSARPVSISEKDKFPKYYEIDDVIVRVDENAKDNTVSGRVLLTGAPYSPAKVVVEGKQISKAEAHRMFKILYPNDKMVTEEK